MATSLVLLFALLSLAVEALAREALLRGAMRRADLAAESGARIATGHFHALVESLEAFAARIAATSEDRVLVAESLAALVRRHPQVVRASLVDLGGTELAAFPDSIPGDVGSPIRLETAPDGTSLAGIEESSAEPLTAITTPIRDEDGVVLDFVVARVSLMDLVAWLEMDGSGAAVVLLDPSGIAARELDRPDGERGAVANTEWARAYGAEAAAVVRVSDPLTGSPAVVAHRRLSTFGWTVLVHQSVADVLSPLASLRPPLAIAAAVFVLLLVAVAGAWSRFLRGGWRELEATRSRLAELEAELDQRADRVRELERRLAAEAAEREAQDEALRLAGDRFALAAAVSSEGLWDFDLSTRRAFYSKRWREILGLADEAPLHRMDDWLERVHADDRERVDQELGAHFEGSMPRFESRHRLLHADGRHRFVLMRGAGLRDRDGRPKRLAGSLADVTEGKLAEDRLAYHARHDSLTGLPNRVFLTEHLERAIERLRVGRRGTVSLLYLDLDELKLVNGSHGHRFGDLVLREVARRLERSVRPWDAVVRVGGDEFAIVLYGGQDRESEEDLARRVQDELRRSFEIEGTEVFLSASVGIAVAEAGGGGVTAAELLRDAETAMSSAKELGGGVPQRFDASMHGRTVSRLELETALHRAIEREELLLHYQPIVELESGRLAGFEALVRWQHPSRGLLGPAEFISLAERTGLIVPLGRFVLEDACRMLASLSDGLDGLSISVNLSSRQIRDPTLVETALGLLERHQIPGRRLHVELTENVIFDDDEETKRVLGCLRAAEIGLSIDDFGTGYSSLSYLHRFPVDVLKIDRSFVTGMGQRSDRLEIVRTIVLLGRAMSLEIVAEGIETDDELDQLRELGCTFGQGYRFSRPVPEAEARRLARSGASLISRSDEAALSVGST